MNVLVAGGSGFVGRHLVPVLLAHGHTVRVMTRHPGTRTDDATDVLGDVSDPSTLAAAMEDIDTAVYLVHTLDQADFVERDRKGAENFAAQAVRSGLAKVVYLGGLGDEHDDLSPHLRSRREVEQILTAALPTIALRAGIVVGDGSVSWEILCQLIERLPVMITPRWVQTKTQPIALDDVVAYLAAAVEMEPVSQIFEVGAPVSMTYKEMLEGAAAELHRRLFILPVPVLSPALSSHWLRLITDVDLQTARSLVDSMTNEVVVSDRRIESVTGIEPTTFADAARQALADRKARKARGAA
jgi:uncharacterized protein YbjT (DUF2867 family)